MRGTDIRVLCLPRACPPHGHAAPGTGSSGFIAGSVSLPAIHEPSLDDSNGDADSKVDAHPQCPIQTNTEPWDPGSAVDSRWSHTRLCRDWNCRGNCAPFSERR